MTYYLSKRERAGHSMENGKRPGLLFFPSLTLFPYMHKYDAAFLVSRYTADLFIQSDILITCMDHDKVFLLPCGTSLLDYFQNCLSMIFCHKCVMDFLLWAMPAIMAGLEALS